MKDLGYMDGPEYEVFKSLYASFEDMIDINRTKIIYLRCPPEECYNRTKLRKRAEENDIPLSYLTLIHEKHEKWFKDCDPSKVLVIDASSNFRDEAAITDALV